MDELNAVNGVERLHDGLRVVDIAAIDGHVAGHHAVADRHDIDRAQIAPQLTHLCRNAGQHAGAVLDFQPHRYAITRTWGYVYSHTSSHSEFR